MTDTRRQRTWRKSSYSSTQTACVEFPGNLDAVRDSKNGDVLGLTVPAVGALLAAVKRGR